MSASKLAMFGGTRVVPENSMLPWPVVTEDDRRAVDRVLLGGKFTSAATGETEIPALEKAWAARVGVQHCASVANGTAGLALALAAAGVGPGDEVVVPALSFIATALAPVHIGAIPVFADVDGETSNLDWRSLEAAIGPRTRAVIPVHLHGLPADMAEIQSVADAHGLVVIEDAAQAHGVQYRGKPVGSLGRVGVFSLNVSKNLATCGEGGLVTTNDTTLHERIVAMRQFGERLPIRGERAYVSHCVGWNAKMGAIEAAFTRGQLARFDADAEARDRNVRKFLKQLDGLPGLIPPPSSPDRGHAWHLLRFRLDPAAFSRPPAWAGALRTTLLRALRAEGVPVSRYQSMPLSAQPVFAGHDAGTPVWETAPSRRLPVPRAEALIEASFTMQKAHLHPQAGPLLDLFAEAFAKVWKNQELIVRMADAL